MTSSASTGPYDWLLFDADGTLFDYETAERAALTQALRRIGVEFKPELLESYRCGMDWLYTLAVRALCSAHFQD